LVVFEEAAFEQRGLGGESDELFFVFLEVVDVFAGERQLLDHLVFFFLDRRVLPPLDVPQVGQFIRSN